MLATVKSLLRFGAHSEESEDPAEHLLLDPRPRGEMNDMVMESMHATSWKFWTVTMFLILTVLVCLVTAWGYMIAEGLGVAGVNRPEYWGTLPGQYRFLDRHQPCRHLRISSAAGGKG